MKGSIELIGMEFFARHGCLESERKDGNTFMVDLSVEYDISAAAGSDDLADTLNYARVYDIVSGQMDIPSNLLENVAARIAYAIKDEFPQTGRIRVSVSKKNPPVSGPVEWSRVSVEI